ncbi:AAA family ATPase [bacterium]|nr:AAA family ATPase [bacterium]
MDFTVGDFQMLYEVLVELFGEKDTFCFDEIQNIQGWERFVRRLHDQKKKIYITGSNSTMLSKELGSHL